MAAVARGAHRHREHGRGGHRRPAGRHRHERRHDDAATSRTGSSRYPGMSLIEEKPYTGYRFFVLNYTQPVDHRHPSKGTFQQRITVLHKDASRPTVFYTGGYNVSTTPSRREPTQIVDGNQVSMEYRYFTPSRPAPADWTKLDIWQAASDQHRIFKALKPVYDKKWVSTGGSKGGMTATYFERFYPSDMDGVVAYVAPNDVVNKEDSAYDRFFAKVGTKECRDRLNAVQREALVRRDAAGEEVQGGGRRRGLHLQHRRQPGQGVRGGRPRLRLGLLAVQPARRLRRRSRRTRRTRPTTRSGRRSTRSPASPSTPTRAWSRTRRTTTRRVRSSARRPSASRTSRRSTSGTATSRRGTSCRATSP